MAIGCQYQASVTRMSYRLLLPFALSTHISNDFDKNRISCEEVYYKIYHINNKAVKAFSRLRL